MLCCTFVSRDLLGLHLVFFGDLTIKGDLSYILDIITFCMMLHLDGWHKTEFDMLRDSEFLCTMCGCLIAYSDFKDECYFFSHFTLGLSFNIVQNTHTVVSSTPLPKLVPLTA